VKITIWYIVFNFEAKSKRILAHRPSSFYIFGVAGLLWAVAGIPLFRGRVDVAGNGGRRPADKKAEKDQEVRLGFVEAPDNYREAEGNRPDDRQARAVNPIVSHSKHGYRSFLTRGQPD